MMKRSLTLLLALLMIVSALVGCANTDKGNDTVSTTDPSQQETVVTTVVETTAAPQLIEIVANGISEYKFIRPDVASTPLVSKAAQLRKDINDKMGVQMPIESDWHKKTEVMPEFAKEIIIGKCDRPDVEEICKSVLPHDYIITYKNGRVFIIGGDDDATMKALDYFTANFVNMDAKTVSIMDNLVYTYKYEYPLGIVSINGTSIRDYKIVYPQGANELVQYAAQNLSEYFFYNGGYAIETVSDNTAESEYEILIGNTNRASSAKGTAVTLGDGQFVLGVDGTKVVMNGNGYMVGGAVGEFINKYAASKGTNVPVDVTTLPTTFTASTYTFEKPDSALLLICDGMGFNHIELAKQQNAIKEFYAEQLPSKGKAITESYSVQTGKASYTDSAAAGTALATANKTLNGYLGMNPSKATLKNIRELAYESGAKTAILSSDAITGATPAAFLVHIADRNSTSGIQAQIDELKNKGKVDYTLGTNNEDSSKLLNYMPEALWGISAGGSAYFSMIEEARCDKISHKVNKGSRSATDVVARVKDYNKIVAYSVEFTLCHPKSVLIITADHETGGIVKNGDTFKYTSDNHTNADVGIFALGYGTEYFNNNRVQNTEIPKFMAKCYGVENFGK